MAGLKASKVSEKVVAFLGRLDEQAADRESFRAGLVKAIEEHPQTGNTISQDLGAYGGAAKEAPKRLRGGKSTQRVATTPEMRMQWLREFEEKEAAKKAAGKR